VANKRQKNTQKNKHSYQRDPFNGTGKPEPLKYELAGCWSRRINSEHRLVYIVEDDAISIVSCMYHY